MTSRVSTTPLHRPSSVGVMEPILRQGADSTPSFLVAHQVVDLDVSFPDRRISGKTEITIHPQSKDLKTITLNLRKCQITRLTVNGKSVSRMQYTDPYARATLAGHTDAHQHHFLREKLGDALKTPPKGELTFDVPRAVHIEEINQSTISVSQPSQPKVPNGDPSSSSLIESAQELADAFVPTFTPLIINIGFSAEDVGDGLHFAAHDSATGRFPHAHTPRTAVQGSACCIFPCVDALDARCTWEFNIKCPRTVGDALRSTSPQDALHNREITDQRSRQARAAHEEREMIVVCSGEDVGHAEDKQDPSKAIFSFACVSALSVQQIAFAIGPFEEVKLSDLRISEDDVGQNAVDVLGYCLPGRSGHLRNTCLPTVRAVDFITLKYVACPFKTYRMCFVDELGSDTAIAGGFTLCSNRLLYPADILDLAEDVTKKLVHAIASQWVGIHIIPQQPTDSWIVVGIAHYIADAFMKELCGNNEYRYRMKRHADLVCDLDRDRPSLFDTGLLLQVDPSELDFMSLKAPLVLFILDRRITKVIGLPKMPAIISKILLRARKGELSGNLLSTELFQKTCERFYHAKIDDFLNQWVRGAGCPRFQAFQKFNKKKLVVEMVIRQEQGELGAREFEPETFMRDVREESSNVWAAPVQNVFTGPMTIRVHEADGTPCEHVVDIKDAQMKFDIPYNTKYKRLKRNRRQREKNLAVPAANTETADMDNDSLLYCLGDVLQTEEDMRKWKIADWSADDEEKMSSESYEWIRIDADFEWICKIKLNMAGYMYASQLQQDRDVVAQMESIEAITQYPPSPLISSIYLRTVMDKRYFHRIRTSAAMAMVGQATPNTDYIGLWHLRKAFEELFCSSEIHSTVPRPNDFSNLATYKLQLGLVQAVARVRDASGVALPEVIDFLLDKLKFNNNDTNQFSDCFYVSVLMQSLCEALCTHHKKDRHVDDMDLDMLDRRDRDRQLEKNGLDVIDRYRRMDEWAGSFQNLYSRTALDCQRRLSDCRVGTVSAIHFLQYTRPGNYDMLRLAAFDNLIQPDMFQNAPVLHYIIFCMSSDPSPWIRTNLQRSFGKILATLAIGDGPRARRAESAEELVIETDLDAQSQQTKAARKRSIEVALAALKLELGDNEKLARSLWAAVNSKVLTLHEILTMLDFCRMLYDPLDSFVLKINYPRYWEVEHLGKGKLKFTRSGSIRTKSFVKWVSKPPSPSKKYDLLPPKVPGPRISFKSSAPPPAPVSTTSHPPSPFEGPVATNGQSEQPRQPLKIKFSVPRPPPPSER